MNFLPENPAEVHTKLAEYARARYNQHDKKMDGMRRYNQLHDELSEIETIAYISSLAQDGHKIMQGMRENHAQLLQTRGIKAHTLEETIGSELTQRLSLFGNYMHISEPVVDAAKKSWTFSTGKNLYHLATPNRSVSLHVPWTYALTVGLGFSILETFPRNIDVAISLASGAATVPYIQKYWLIKNPLVSVANQLTDQVSLAKGFCKHNDIELHI